MKGLIHPILSTYESPHLSVLSAATNEADGGQSSVILAPEENNCSKPQHISWQWKDSQFDFDDSNFQEINEWFLVFSNRISIAEQIEALLSILQATKDLHLGRIVSFVDCDALSTKNIELWMDGVAHFSDAICFCNRSNSNAEKFKFFNERYRTQHFPMEIFILSNKRVPPINRIFSPVSRKMTHVFDPIELLDEEDTPDQDPYLKKNINGQREKEIPLIFA